MVQAAGALKRRVLKRCTAVSAGSDREVAWNSPDGRTRNETDYFIADKRYIFKDVTIVNKFGKSRDQRMKTAKIVIKINIERNKIMNRQVNSWTKTFKINSQRMI